MNRKRPRAAQLVADHCVGITLHHIASKIVIASLHCGVKPRLLLWWTNMQSCIELFKIQYILWLSRDYTVDIMLTYSFIFFGVLKQTNSFWDRQYCKIFASLNLIHLVANICGIFRTLRFIKQNSLTLIQFRTSQKLRVVSVYYTQF